MIGYVYVQSQTNDKMTADTNPLLCDIKTGMCEMPASKQNENTSNITHSTKKHLKVIYFTDPICSTCWGIEPQLRKLKLEYGDALDIEYRMGGLLPDWSYNSGGISKPADVAHHWDEVSTHYDMPIDGDVWLEDPLDSSYPPSIAFKASQLQDNEKAIQFLRILREMVFLEKKNIAKWAHIAEAAKRVELDVSLLKTDFEGSANDLFQDDLKLGKELGVRGFPSLYFVDEYGNKEFVYGFKPYAFYEDAILKLAPWIVKNIYNSHWEAIFGKFQTMTAKEFSEISGTARSESEPSLDNLVVQGKLEKFTSKNGSIWKRI